MDDVAVYTLDSPKNRIFLSYQFSSRDRSKQIELLTPDQNNIFIAYELEDENCCFMLDAAISRQFAPWHAWEDMLNSIEPQQQIQIEGKIRAADVFVLIISQASVKSERLATEFDLALKLNKLGILVLWLLGDGDETIPKHWRNSLWMPIELPGFDDLFDQLAKTIIHIRAYARLPAGAGVGMS